VQGADSARGLAQPSSASQSEKDEHDFTEGSHGIACTGRARIWWRVLTRASWRRGHGDGAAALQWTDSGAGGSVSCAMSRGCFRACAREESYRQRRGKGENRGPRRRPKRDRQVGLNGRRRGGQPTSLQNGGASWAALLARHGRTRRSELVLSESALSAGFTRRTDSSANGEGGRQGGTRQGVAC
jgi:hypothetical protein